MQINAARQAAVGLGTTIETKSGQLSLGEISEGATIGGILLALGVLAMTVGLIRSETAGDLRTLTAAGAGGRTRRALTGVTAGVIALLGAALGTVAGFLAALAWAHCSLTQDVRQRALDRHRRCWSSACRWSARVAGWLLGGRAPSAVSRQPLE